MPDEGNPFEVAELPWPRKGDNPFVLGDEINLIACVNFTHDEPWGGYAQGFKMAADLAVGYCAERGFDQDFLVYPIFFNYRHYIELALKEIIRASRRYLDEPGGVPDNHNLSDLWNTAEPLLKRIEPKGEKTYRHVRESIDYLTVLDPKSETWRYPVTKSGESSLPEKLYRLDLGKIRDVVERLSSFFDAVISQLLELLDYKAEEEREMDFGY